MKRGGGVSGAVSLVMIFCVLCLAVFSVLTLATANREAGLAELTAERAESYYEADAEAAKMVASLRPGEETEFSLPAGGEQELSVKALRREDGRLEILRWKTVYAGSWEIEDTIELWDGF